MKYKIILLVTISILIFKTGLAQDWQTKIDPLISSAYHKLFEPSTLTKSEMDDPYCIAFAPPILNLIDESKSDPVVRVFILSSNDISELIQEGIKIQSKVGNIFTAHLNLSKVSELAQIEGVQTIQIGLPVISELDVSADKIRAPDAWAGFGYQGENIIIGIIDSGIDITHEDFKNPNGTTRILYIWDQLDNQGPHPFGYDYGTEWNYNDINNGVCDETDQDGHGTHVSGIAGGNGRATGNGQPANTYVGIAPKADIIFVKVDYNNSANVIDGLLWIGKKAAQLQKPWVANLSLGTNFGPHDGTSLFEKAVFGVTNQPDLGKGKIIVKSAGNNGYDPNNPNTDENDRIHSSGIGSSGATFRVNSSSIITNEFSWIQIWYPQSTNYSVSLTAPGGRVYGPYWIGQGTGNPNEGYIYTTDTDGWVSVHNEHWNDQSNKRKYYPLTEDNMIEIMIGDVDYLGNHYALRNGSWLISMFSGSGRWDAYIPYGQLIAGGMFFADFSYENARIISEPGNAYNVITVGSFNSKNNWLDIDGNPQYFPGFNVDQKSWFSSPGPTRDGRTKPDIYAPGAWISSSRSDDNSNIPQNRYQISRDGVHYNTWGTSMSVPHVAGAIALLLQQDEDYTYSDILDILIQSQTSQGYLDVYAALDINGDPTGVEDAIAIESGPNSFSPNDVVTYTARFYDEPPPSYMYNWNWKINLYHVGGIYS